MQKFMKKVFTNNVIFAIAMAFIVLFMIFTAFIMERTSDLVLCFMTAATAFFLYFSYRKHDKNIMKGLLGVQLAILTVTAAKLLDFSESTPDAVFAWVAVALYLLLTINHFVINSSHYARPTHVFFNQLLCLLVGIVCVAWDIFSAIDETGRFVYYIATALNSFFQIYMVVYIESKLDGYRIKREANGWTLEQGYSEEYNRAENYGK